MSRTALEIPLARRHGNRCHPCQSADEGNVIRAARVVRATHSGGGEQLRSDSVSQTNAEQVQIESPPSSRTRARCKAEYGEQQSVLQQIKPAIVEIVEMGILDYILVGKDDERVEKDPPSHQHHEIQQAEMDLPFFFREVRTPGHRRDHGHRMHEENDVEEKYVGNGSPQHDLTIGPGGRLQAQSENPRVINAQKLRS